MSAGHMQLFDDARRLIQDQAHPLGTEPVALEHALGRILAADVVSDMDMPPFDKSAMDGYACRREDLAGDLRVVETIPAGTPPQKRVGPGECSKIMTGAIVPEGADCVVQVEITEAASPGSIRCTGKSTRDNICRQAEDIRRGDTVLHKGEWILPQHVAVLATVGCVQPTVAKRPTVGVVTTGDEIVEPGDRPAQAQIRNSNGPQLCAQVRQAGALDRYYGIVADTEEALDTVVRQAVAECDVLLMSGGVSMGDFDLVPSVLKRNGLTLLFEKIAVKPGMPTVFGVSDDAFCFGLPGNPVSTFVIFELLVKPFLLGLMGHAHRTCNVPMQLAGRVFKRRIERDAWIPVRISGPGTVQAIEYHGSGHLNALTGADGLICVPRGVQELAAGATVDVRPL